jgi:hypothetical protein
MSKETRKVVDDARWRSIVVFFVCTVGLIFLLLGATTFAQDIKAKQKTVSTSPALSLRAQVLMHESWSDSSFVRGIAIIADKTETRDSRSVAMELLHANRRKLGPNDMRQLLDEVTTIAKNRTNEEELSAQAIHIMGNLTLTMNELGQLSRAESKKEAGFFLSVTTDSRRGSHMRSEAINALGILKITEAVPSLQQILTESVNVPEIARPACLSLMRIDSDRAVPVLAEVLQKTTDSHVFGTAAFALGHINTRESMVAIVQNLGRFPESGACGAALVNMEDVIFIVLKNTQDERLAEGIQATRYLWREGQRDRYIPIIQGLLNSAPPVTRKVALNRLLEEASTQDFEKEKIELTTILELIKDQPQLSEYQEKIRTRLAARVVTPSSGVTTPTPILQRGVGK